MSNAPCDWVWTALSNHIDSLTCEAVEDLLGQLAIDGLNLDEVVNQLQPNTRLRIARIRSATRTTKSINFNSRVIVEQDDKWYVHYRNKQPELLMDAILRIDALIMFTDRNQTYYAGRVIYQGQQIEFCTAKEIVEKDTLKWINQLLLTNFAAILNRKTSWSRYLIDIATQLHTPKIITGLD